MPDRKKQASIVRLLILDVDGVLTDGRLLYGSDGSELKGFHTHDGHGIKRLLQHGIDVAIISGRESAGVTRRMRELGVRHVFQGCDDKVTIYKQLITELKLDPSEVAFAGDDLPDFDLMGEVGLPIAVANAHASILKRTVWQTKRAGGDGAVREICDFLIESRPA